jgi:acyl phosphate:glycerol-3-phosphate acyltransferase
MLPAALLLLAYLIGSIPFSFLVVKAFAGADIRQHGSRNVGATNVARTFGKLPGIIALLLDIAKGYGAVAAAAWIVCGPGWPYRADVSVLSFRQPAFWIGMAALAAIVGHMFPIWLRFHGGKGVATATGAFLAMNPLVVVGGVLVFIVVLLTTRFVSLSSMLSAASIPLFFRYFAHAPFWTDVFSIAIAILVIAKHHSNIARLAHGTERRLGERNDERKEEPR